MKQETANWVVPIIAAIAVWVWLFVMIATVN